jgi:ATP-dependent DNA helicase RecG
LFAANNTEYNIHLGRFKTPSLIIDDKMLNSTLFEAVEETMNYIIGQIKVAFEITGKTTKRTEIFEYPLPALRELVLNAIIHRDYLSPIDIQIKIFDQSITFYNPGKLYGDLTIEQLQKDNYQANTRNKLIAEAFYLVGDIEKYGSGFLRIRDEISNYPTMKFDFENAPNGFLTQFSYEVQKTSTDLDINAYEKPTEKPTDKPTDNLSSNQIKIIKYLSEKPNLSSKELADLLQIRADSVRENLSKLKNKGLIKRIGPARGGYWQIKNIDNEKNRK